DRSALPAAGNAPPDYPWTARARGHQGRVVLSVWVSAAGLAERLAVLHSSGYASLDRAAMEAVERWRFRPARRAG
ncbi:MAG: TonB family protein, partial [Gammaproteobacteria bacterium]|nr:TonB family protein [Gammaproteobacteria bacterium]NIM73479.1 TonB family protein [Gammaproteobacteria bacterium]NIN39888.1 TonB family protein [Gammaproteobacteria bacterium]NIO25288.1 TonB family protein [Gammaproteobacteria bacterium]NIO65915.1 TonB family protein [Gammaproteobacteria bacterium]